MIGDYVIIIAPRREMERLVAPCPFNWGTNNPFTISFDSGFAYASAPKKKTNTINTTRAMNPSNFLIGNTVTYKKGKV